MLQVFQRGRQGGVWQNIGSLSAAYAAEVARSVRDKYRSPTCPPLHSGARLEHFAWIAIFQISITNELSSNYGGRGRGRPGESRRRKASRGWRGDTQLRRPRQLAGFAIGSRKTRSFHARTHGSGSFPSLCELERSCLRRRENSLELGSNRGAISVRVIAITRCKSPLKFFSYTFSASLITKKIRSSGMIHILYVVILRVVRERITRYDKIKIGLARVD